MVAIGLTPWVATRIFRPNDNEFRAVISNELYHEFLVLEDASALLWGAIADNPGISAEQIADGLSFPVDEVREFVTELFDAGLLTIDGQSTAQPSIRAAELESRSQRPTSGRNESGTNVEAVPGGDNLEAEFEFQDWARQRGYLWAASWEMTYRCNESCIHCFNPGASHKQGQAPQRKTDELTRDEWLSLLHELKGIGVFRLMLTGGEVGLHRDFFDVLTEARKLGFSTTVFTNGTLFDTAELDQLASLFPHRIELSIYAATADKHDEITKLPKSFEKTISAGKYLHSAGVTVAFKMSVMKNTVDQVIPFRVLCASLECEGLVDFNMSAGVDGARDPLLDLLPEPVSLIREAGNPTSPLYVGTPDVPRRQNWSELRDLPVCGAGLSTMSISPEGNISPCNSLPLHVGSVREKGISEIWRLSRVGSDKANDSLLSQWQETTRSDYVICGSLSHCEWCHKCPGLAFLEVGNELLPSVVNCRNAAARLLAHTLLCEGRDPTIATEFDLSQLQKRFPEYTALWQTQERFSRQISLESVRENLRQRAKVSVLLKNPC